jgi:hypothetical protein
MIIDRQPEAVTHEIDVALDRLGRNFQLGPNLLTVWKLLRLQGRMETHHPLQRRPRKSVVGVVLLL